MLDHLVRALQHVSSGYENYVRFAAMRTLLAPAARHSLSIGTRCADQIARFLAATTYEGAVVRNQMEAAYGATRAPALTRGWFARPLRDFVFLRRVLTGRQVLRPDLVEHTGSSAARQEALRTGPVILATGHFARQAVITLLSPAVTPGLLGQVTLHPPGRSLRPYPLRMGLQFGTFLRTQAAVRGAAGTFIYTVAGGQTGLDLFRHLVKLRGKVSVALDAPWSRDRDIPHQRAFAGQSRAVFSLGPVRLSRVTQTPVVLAIPYLGEGGRTVIEWHGPFAPPPPEAWEAEAALCDLLLDRIETAVGERPTQYVMKIGGQRRWDDAARQWRPR
ncbi:MAG TPA: hypothetical protein VFD85_13760 [Gemmatimonadales bacterium]|nr:hypothetical protein [Gemmatimonadales bacterium]